MGTIEAERNLIGIPIEGSITGIGERKVQQLPIEDLQPLLKAVYDDPGIHSFGWRQYTPYYNDGEQCVFGVGNVWFLTPEDAEDPEDEKLREESYYTWEEVHSYAGAKGFAPTCTEQFYDEEKLLWSRKVWSNQRYDEARYERCKELSEALWNNEFDVALLAKFGDHAIVTITKDKITVEFYEHE